MSLMDLQDWINIHAAPDSAWYMKRLAANDTLATNAHQAGPYIEKQFLFRMFPSLQQSSEANPRATVTAYIDSHADAKQVTAIWYNQKTRNEARITGWGGRNSALLDPESTGALAAFVFRRNADGQCSEIHAWVCDNRIEEDVIEDRIAGVEPGRAVIWEPSALGDLLTRPAADAASQTCRLTPDTMPAEWLVRFPSGIEIINKTISLRPLPNIAPDKRLMLRRKCEYEMFLSVEEAIEKPVITKGFDSVDAFVSHAQTVLQRRKSRSGRSLELHTKMILQEEGFVEGQTFSHSPESEKGRKPDFLFPCETAYADPRFPAANLRMLAAKTTCKDRWRQILREADRVPCKHLLTLQEGVSLSQFNEMKEQQVQLVVPAPLLDSYPEEVRPQIITLEAFISEVRHLAIAKP